MGTVIDLRKYEPPLREFIVDSAARFADEHPRTEISAVALSGSGFHGDVAIHFDTAKHSAAHVAQFEKNGDLWYGQDDHGTFCDNGEDFEFARFNEMTFPGFPDLYSEAFPTHFISLNGKKVAIDGDGGDEALNEAVFPFLKEMLATLAFQMPSRRAKPFRVGVCMNDSYCKEFWLAGAEKQRTEKR